MEIKKQISLEVVNSNAAGIDIGSRSHWVAVGQNAEDVKEFGVYSQDQLEMCHWLHSNGVTSIAMESTGTYWQNLFSTLVGQGFDVILCGGPAAQEKQFADEISALCQHKPVNLVGQTTLKRLLALIKHSTLVLAPDTGPAHMATAVSTPVIGLYAHHNPERTGPYFCQKYVINVYKELIETQTGKKQSQLAWRARVKSDSAMTHISPAQVINVFDNVSKELKIRPL